MAEPVEILCVGNELLIGKTLNTNAHWIAKRMTTLGLNVCRITIVGDDIDEITTALNEAIQRNPRFLITTGGLGPTFDDKTLEGLSKALECKLEINEEALTMVKAKYLKYAEEGRIEKAELTLPRVKMATLPVGAKPLSNPIGTAPGVIMEHEDITIVTLPGVPSEMKAIFDGSVSPLLRQVAGNVTFFEAGMETTGVTESEIAPLIDQVMHDNPYVYIKSHPKGTEKTLRIEFYFSTTAETSAIARKRVSRTFVHLSELIQRKGGKIRPTKAENGSDQVTSVFPGRKR